MSKNIFNPAQLPKKESKLSAWITLNLEQRKFLRECRFIPQGFRAPLTHFRYGYYKHTLLCFAQFERSRNQNIAYPTKLLEFKWWCTQVHGTPSEGQNYLGSIDDEEMASLIPIFGLDEERMTMEEEKNEDELKAQIKQKEAELEHLRKKIRTSRENSVNLVGKKPPAQPIIENEEDFFLEEEQPKKKQQKMPPKPKKEVVPFKKEVPKKKNEMKFLKEAYGNLNFLLTKYFF